MSFNRGIASTKYRPSVCSAVIGELDEDIDSQLDLSSIKAEPLLPVVH